ncbi:DNA-binding protein (plasmid) [Photobacterium damselae subsp. damselae]|uniref:H-NS histone family protein n=1 Tax=Photobacterium damselae TaxID=38293 RepID=UPI000A353B6A|nr:DNA-binding protein [Photobacterium damselae subsp. damselae]
METYRQLLQADGITVEDLITLTSHSKLNKATRKPSPAKYRYIDDAGHEKTWTGQGRPPTFLVDKNLDDYLL